VTTSTAPTSTRPTQEFFPGATLFNPAVTFASRQASV
jgi:hypothetical protein